ncbi:family 43 glycosylhydrolase, partial [Parvularcula maris]|nr:family 43 glycosylhydrolase [Parvularcula maris]
MQDFWTADPAVLEKEGTVYLYAGHDQAVGDEPFRITEWLAYSTTDMRNWTALGPIMEPTDFSWASGRAWASEVEEKDGTYWFYTSVERSGGQGMAIGVARSDHPAGPFTDAKGAPLITNDMTPDKTHWYNDIDPTVYTDDDGTSWIAWGNEQYYFARLKDNMIELDGAIRTAALPFYVEGPWIYQHEELYYLTYAGIDRSASNDEQIRYATSSLVEGPWNYRGMLTGSAENSFTIHPATVDLERFDVIPSCSQRRR